jgi:hypothetical protein
VTIVMMIRTQHENMFEIHRSTKNIEHTKENSTEFVGVLAPQSVRK